MKGLLALLFMLVLFIAFVSDVKTKELTVQTNGAIIMFCEYYDTQANMPINSGVRFTKGNICVIANLGFPINQTSVIIQLDRYNSVTGKYEYYNSINFNINPAYSYIYFNNVYFGLSGHYRVFLLYRNRSVIVNGLVEII